MVSRFFTAFSMTLVILSIVPGINTTPKTSSAESNNAVVGVNTILDVMRNFESVLSSDGNFIHSLQGLLPNINKNANLSDIISQLSEEDVNVFDVLTRYPNTTSASQDVPGILTSLLSSNPSIIQTLKNIISTQSTTRTGSFVDGIFSLLGMPTTNDRSTEQLGSLLKSWLVTGAKIGLQNINVSESCINGTVTVIKSVIEQELWALKFIDAMGKPLAGILEGGLQWLGSFHQCLNIISTPHDENTTLIGGNYCLLKIPLPSSLLALLSGVVGEKLVKSAIIQYGVCMPDSCSADDVSNIVNLGLIQQLLGSFYGEDTPTVEPVCHQQDNLWKDKTALAVVGILCIIGLLILTGTVYDIAVELYDNHKTSSTANESEALDIEQDIRKPQNPASNNIPSVTAEIESDERLQSIPYKSSTGVYMVKSPSSETGIDAEPVNRLGLAPGWKAFENSHKPTTTAKKCTMREIIDRPLRAFSLYTNVEKLLNTDTKSGNLGSVNGIRFISMSWVILGHSISERKLKSNIAAFGPEFQSRWTAQAVTNSFVSVDSFFTLSGLLLAYLTLKEMGKRKSAKINWFLFYFHRFWRLTPPYMLIFMVYVSLFQYWGNGPIWTPEPAEATRYANGKANWWQNILYINNFIDMSNTRMPWTWYLAIDMQFYIISPILLIPLFYSKVVGLTILGMFFLAHFIATGIISAVNEFPASGGGVDFGYKMYDVPWCRIGPYLAGILVGYILYKTDRKIKLHKSTVILGWCAAAICGLSTVYGLYSQNTGHPLSVGASAVYNSLNRTAWGAGVGWVIFACCTGYGGVVNTFLSWKLFIPLARLTYCTYLIHPIVIEYVSQSAKFPQYLSDVTVSYEFVGHLVFSYAIAFLASLAFEAPMVGLEKIILRRR